MKRHSIYMFLKVALPLLAVFCSCKEKRGDWIEESEIGQLKLKVITDSILVPFGMTFLPNEKLLVTNRPKGDIIMVDIPTGNKQILKGIPPSFSNGDGGALDILAHPNYEDNGWVYFAHAVGDSTASTLAIDRFRLKGDSIVNMNRVFTVLPFYNRPNHFGTRMVINNGYLYFTMGDRYHLPDSAQTLKNHLGKVMRIFEDGKLPPDNPFVEEKNALPEIWSIGHRNPQGLAFHPSTGELWENEHGPKGGDEVNIIRERANYGWPIICYGVDYDDTPIGKGVTHQEGLEQPLYHYTPSIAPSGMEFYTGSKIPQWKGNLFIGALALRHLNRLEIRDNKIVREERLFEELDMRVRNVKQGPDGFLYISVDGGKIIRIEQLNN